MIFNKNCPYCKTKLNSIENHKESKTVEHLIPNSMTSKKRNNNNGDFYACKNCNSNKSKMDNLVGKISKFQSFDDNLASSAMIKEYTKEKKNTRLVDVLNSTLESKYGIYAKLPFNGEELYSYMEYLGKGQYFKKTTKIYSKSKYIMIFKYMNKEFNIIFSDSYLKQFGSDNFKDLSKNPYSEVINNGECIIYAKENNKYLFVFHSHTTIIIEIYKRCNRTQKMAIKNKQKILNDFGNSNKFSVQV